jgi:hypothetical protein
MKRTFITAALLLTACLPLATYTSSLRIKSDLAETRRSVGLVRNKEAILCQAALLGAAETAALKAHYPGFLTTSEARTLDDSYQKECSNVVPGDMGVSQETAPETIRDLGSPADAGPQGR